MMKMNLKEEMVNKLILSVAHDNFEKGLNVHAFFKVRNRALSEDLVQETFMKTWGYLVRGGKVDLMRAFLYHILNDLIVDEYRKHKSVSLDVLLESGYAPPTNLIILLIS